MRASHHLSSSSPGSRLDQTSLAEKSGLHSQRDLTKDTAETYLDAMWSHYLVSLSLQTRVGSELVSGDAKSHRSNEIYTSPMWCGRRGAALFDIAKILPKSLDKDQMAMLVKNNTAEEARKAEITKERGVLEESLKVLRIR